MTGGWVTMVGLCCSCGGVFTFNPIKVPSIRINGTREPICKTCVEAANVKRVEMGLPPHPIHPEAYEACSEEELWE